MAVLPLYEMHGEINTLEGWNGHRKEMARIHLRPILGREPTDQETSEEMAHNTAEGERLLREWGVQDSKEEIPICYFGADGHQIAAVVSRG